MVHQHVWLSVMYSLLFGNSLFSQFETSQELPGSSKSVATACKTNIVQQWWTLEKIMWKTNLIFKASILDNECWIEGDPLSHDRFTTWDFFVQRSHPFRRYSQIAEISSFNQLDMIHAKKPPEEKGLLVNRTIQNITSITKFPLFCTLKNEHYHWKLMMVGR